MTEQTRLKNIWIILPDLIGSTICALPTINALIEHFSADSMEFIGFKNTSEILIDIHPYNSNLVILPEKANTDKCLQKIASDKQAVPDMVIDFLCSRESSSFLKSSQIGIRVGRDHYGSNAYTSPIISNSVGSCVEYYLDYLLPLGLKASSMPPKLQSSEMTTELGRNWLRERNLDPASDRICILGVGGGNKRKRWPLSNYVEISRYFKEKHGVVCVFVIGPKEINLKDELEELIPNSIIALNLSLDLLKGVIANVDLSVCNDYAVMHISASLGIPTHGVFLSSNPLEWFPYNPPSRYIIGAEYLRCRPCYIEDCEGWTCNSPDIASTLRESLENFIRETI